MSDDTEESGRGWPPLAPTLFAVATVALLGVLSPVQELTTPGRPSIAVGLLAVALGGSLVRTEAPLRAVGWFLASFVAMSAVALGVLFTTERLWLGAIGLAAVGGTVSYGLHRYERLELGLVEEVHP